MRWTLRRRWTTWSRSERRRLLQLHLPLLQMLQVRAYIHECTSHSIAWARYPQCNVDQTTDPMLCREATVCSAGSGSGLCSQACSVLLSTQCSLLFAQYSTKQDARQRSWHAADAAAGPSSSAQQEEAAQEARFLAFQGTGRRLDGKAAVGGPPVPVDIHRGARQPPPSAPPPGGSRSPALNIHQPGLKSSGSL